MCILNIDQTIVTTVDLAKSTALDAAMAKLWLSKKFRVYFFIALAFFGIVMAFTPEREDSLDAYGLQIVSFLAIVLPFVFVRAFTSALWKSGQIKSVRFELSAKKIDIYTNGTSVSYDWDRIDEIRESTRFLFVNVKNGLGFFIEKQPMTDDVVKCLRAVSAQSRSP